MKLVRRTYLFNSERLIQTKVRHLGLSPIAVKATNVYAHSFSELPPISYPFGFLKLHYLIVMCQLYIAFLYKATIRWCRTFISPLPSKLNLSSRFRRIPIDFYVLNIGIAKKQNSRVQHSPVLTLMKENFKENTKKSSI